MTAHRLIWPFGEATVLTTAAMLDACTFRLGNRHFAPFARAPWMGTLHDPAISGHLRQLGGDFVCLPFGTERIMEDAPGEWAGLLTQATGGPIHGPAADLDWTVLAASDTAVILALDYPETSDVLRIEREISVRPDAPALDCVFRIHARRRAQTSTGLHPILRLPDHPGRLHLSGAFDFGMVHPGYGGQTFERLDAVPKSGGTVDMSHVPLMPKTDLNVQLCGMREPLRAIYLDEGAGLDLDWDRSLLPSLQIWHTDGGIGAPPFNGAYRGIGIEPVASAFDLGASVSCAPNPINARGIATQIQIDPATPVIIRHTIRAFAT
jgi:hypothetical protein